MRIFFSWIYVKYLVFVFRRVPLLKGKKGAVIVEYGLLLVACVGVALLIQKAVQPGDDKDSSGWMINMWMGILNDIAEDM